MMSILPEIKLNENESQKSKPVFKLCELTPIGFKIPNYPSDICSVCRGKLLEVCEDCAEKNNERCDVMINSDNIIYHTHCSVFIKKPVLIKK